MSERKGKPSASYLQQIALCPGSWQAQQGLPEQPTSDSKTGDIIHGVLAGLRSPADLDSDQQRTYDNLQFNDEKLCAEYGLGAERDEIEIRYWHRTGRFSGQPDRVRFASEVAVVRDFKTGWKEVEHAASNLQLRALAVLAWDNFPVGEVVVAIIHAHGPTSVAKYNSEELLRAEKEILAILDKADKPNVKRIPGAKQCQYCRAKATCPEARDAALAMDIVPVKAVSALTAEKLGEYMARVELARKVCDALEDETKRRIAAGEAIPGWTLKQGEAREKIVNLPTVHARACEEFGVSVEQFTQACSLTKKDAKAMLEKATGRKGKALDDALDILIEGNTEAGKTPAPSLVKEAA